MPSEPAMTPDLLGKGLGARARGVLDLFFGYDFFISYAHADGGNYTLELSERLQSIGYKVFLDHHEYTAGEELNQATRRRIGMSRKLVVVVRPAALDSVWVSKEVEASLAAGKTPIAVDINATLTEAAPENPLKRMLADRIYIEERKDDPDGSPDEATLQSLVKSFRATRLESLRLRAAMAGVGVFALLFVAATALFVVAEQRAIQIENTCNTIISQLDRGWALIDSFRTTQFGKLIAGVAEDLAKLPRPSDFKCDQG
ncbi:MAG: toll/interleukin-1 receptor domain-containing protein [Gammaproteobacteria bacterium]|nr:toll/interleukin-1 receptor domain-containing protein [Gammaproteobacteria bacterium]MCP5444736.1 toll/interleukin-1 receptor domain-containing protein [Chromatiaceae bacterium]